MIVFRLKRFSGNILGLQGGALGIRKNKDGSTRKYDMDMNRLGSLKTLREGLGSLDLTKELRKAREEMKQIKL
jgi:hypothetical protein